MNVGGIEDVAQLVAGEAIGAGVEGVEIGSEESATALVPGERRAIVADIGGEGGETTGSISELQYTLLYEIEAPARVEGGGRRRVVVGSDSTSNECRQAVGVRRNQCQRV